MTVEKAFSLVFVCLFLFPWLSRGLRSNREWVEDADSRR